MSDAPTFGRYAEIPVDRMTPEHYDHAVTVLEHESLSDMIVPMGYDTAVSLTMNFHAVPAGSPGVAR